MRNNLRYFSFYFYSSIGFNWFRIYFRAYKCSRPGVPLSWQQQFQLLHSRPSVGWNKQRNRKRIYKFSFFIHRSEHCPILLNFIACRRSLWAARKFIAGISLGHFCFGAFYQFTTENGTRFCIFFASFPWEGSAVPFPHNILPSTTFPLFHHSIYPSLIVITIITFE